MSESTGTLKKEQIRVLVSNIYDLQKMRISAGNRLVQSFYLQLGIRPSESHDDASDDVKNMVETLKKEYKRITDTVALNNISIKKSIELINKNSKKDNTEEDTATEVEEKTKKKGRKKKDVAVEETAEAESKTKKKETELRFIRDDNDYKLIESYMYLLKSEEENIKVLEKIVKQHPMWDGFFNNIKGCGPLMSGVCLAYLDPYKARHVSSFFRYAGLDTVQDVDDEGNRIFLTLDDNRRKVKQVFEDDGTYKYLDIETNELYEGEVIVSCHGRRKGDTEMQQYFVYENGEKVVAVDENGNPLLKRGITYNPKLKTKLMGVLTGCLLKAKDPTYSKIYYDQRVRYDNSAYHKDKSDGQKNMMAQRYMVKEFLRAMWIKWRTLEGLEVDEPYEVAKLGNKPHKYNEYQCRVANGQAEVE